MPRTARVKLKGEVAYYFVTSHTVWERQKAFSHYEKQYFLTLLRKLSKLFFVDVLAYVIMDNHFHLLIRIVPSRNFSDEEILRRIEFFYGPRKIVSAHELPYWRKKLEDLSEFVKYLKQLFAQWYNKRHNRKGHLWSQRFHSVLLQKGEAVIAAAIYTELNPVRAGITEKPESFFWCSYSERRRGNHWMLPFQKWDIEEVRNLKDYKNILYGEIHRHGLGENRTISPFLRKINHFTMGIVIGNKSFVEKVLIRFRKKAYTYNLNIFSLFSKKIRI